MIRQKEVAVSDAVLSFLHESGLETPLLQYRLVQAWPEVVGEECARLSEALEIRDGVLWVRVSVPALATELQMRRSQLAATLNARVGATIIRDIRFVNN